jgi:hypothetical protein
MGASLLIGVLVGDGPAQFFNFVFHRIVHPCRRLEGGPDAFNLYSSKLQWMPLNVILDIAISQII